MIHTRVPERLETELRERAEELGTSVSNLVRNVLGHAFGLVGDVVADGHAIARAARGGGRAATPATTKSTIDDVLGWQAMVLAKNAVCERCNALLPKGSEAALGVGSSHVICKPCLVEVTR